MDKLRIGRFLTAKRREKGVTQEELAQFLGVSKASVSKWETGQSYPDITLLPHMAAYFNVSIDELIGYEPQMTRADIRRLYHRLAEDFAEKPFEHVMEEIREISKKYFSCFPLLLQMGILVLNHHALAGEDLRQDLIREALSLFVRIKSECADVELCRQANVMEAYCHLLLSEPVPVIDLLADAALPSMNERNLLAAGYSMNGQPDKAKEALKIGIYEQLLSLLQNLSSLLQLEAADAEATRRIVSRFMQVAEAFELRRLHPSTLLSFHLLSAQVYMMQANREQALRMIERYADLAAEIRYPIVLRGDDFFDSIGGWLSGFDLGVEAPRSDRLVRQSIVDGVVQNPVFAPLAGDIAYINIIHKLKAILEG